MSWTKCPVCNGCGAVDKYFYPMSAMYSTAVTIYDSKFVPCRSCNGRGVLETRNEVVNHNHTVNHYSLFGSRALNSEKEKIA